MFLFCYLLQLFGENQQFSEFVTIKMLLFTAVIL